jgi:hypothetical protein
MDKFTFEHSKKLNQLSNYYYEKAEKETDEKLKKVYEEFYNHLDELHSHLLKIGKYQDDKNYIGVTTRNIKTYGDLPSYTQIDVIYHYDNGFSLVEDTAGDLHLIPTDIIE